MSFKISDFKSTMDRFGGPARPHLFEVTLSKIKNEPSSEINGQTISFFCNSVNFPGVVVENGQMTINPQECEFLVYKIESLLELKRFLK